MNDLELIGTDDLIAELMRRYESLVIAGVPMGSKSTIPTIALKAPTQYHTAGVLVYGLARLILESPPTIDHGPFSPKKE